MIRDELEVGIVLTFCPISVIVVPHITDAIQEWVMRQAQIPVDEDGIEPQVCVIEVCSIFLTKFGVNFTNYWQVNSINITFFTLLFGTV